MRRRAGFTLVEMLVAMALILFIISILVSAFVAGMKSVSDFKAAGDLAEKERAVFQLLRRDLAADHFEGKKRLSQPDFWADGPPREGIFRVYQAAPDVNEGPDLDGVPSFRQTFTAMHYTVKLRGNNRGDFFSADVPANSPLLSPLLGLPERRYQDTANSYNSQWAEVAVFLAPAANAVGVQDTTTGPQPQPLYSLYRRQRLAVPDNSLVTAASGGGGVLQAQAVDATGNNLYLEVSTNVAQAGNGPLYFNSPRDLTMPVRRLGMDPANPAGVLTPNYAIAPNPPNYPVMAQENVNYVAANNGPLNTNYQSADLLLTDVLSFDVRLLIAGNGDFVDLFDPTVQPYGVSTVNNATAPNNPAFAFSTTGQPKGPLVFDTWSSVAQPDAGFDYSDPKWATPGTPASIPLYQNAAGQKIQIKAVQITLRVWDFKTKKTRQVTMVQDL